MAGSPTWKDSRLGRQLIGYAVAVVALFVSQSVVGFAMQRAPQDSALSNRVAFAALSLFASSFIHPVLRVPGVLAVAGLAAGLAMPAFGLTILDVTMGLSTVALLVIVPRRKRLSWISRAASSTGSSGVTGPNANLG